MTFGRAMLAAFTLCVLTGLIESYSSTYAYWFVVLTLLALFLRYPDAAQEVRNILTGKVD